MDCLFCKIIAGEIPSRMAYQDERVVAFHDIAPQAPVHILIVPREHLSGLSALTADHGPLLGAIHAAANTVAQQHGIAETGYRLVVNNGPHSGQTIFHLHYHLLGGAPLGRFGA
ncbi:MAG: histidine triad nucleotide-binding protein [Chloroflexota bacterium]|nr:histidine triad nucleotide-binding protein [Dehalococcoidia bacterium]MDW8254731.1 histidine triad nucleotide-binding protein [Chloroflexota bacterium]